jgi:hypothetical protein
MSEKNSETQNTAKDETQVSDDSLESVSGGIIEDCFPPFEPVPTLVDVEYR